MLVLAFLSAFCFSSGVFILFAAPTVLVTADNQCHFAYLIADILCNFLLFSSHPLLPVLLFLFTYLDYTIRPLTNIDLSSLEQLMEHLTLIDNANTSELVTYLRKTLGDVPVPPHPASPSGAIQAEKEKVSVLFGLKIRLFWIFL